MLRELLHISRKRRVFHHETQAPDLALQRWQADLSIAAYNALEDVAFGQHWHYGMKVAGANRQQGLIVVHGSILVRLVIVDGLHQMLQLDGWQIIIRDWPPCFNGFFAGDLSRAPNDNFYSCARQTALDHLFGNPSKRAQIGIGWDFTATLNQRAAVENFDGIIALLLNHDWHRCKNAAGFFYIRGQQRNDPIKTAQERFIQNVGAVSGSHPQDAPAIERVAHFFQDTPEHTRAHAAVATLARIASPHCLIDFINKDHHRMQVSQEIEDHIQVALRAANPFFTDVAHLDKIKAAFGSQRFGNDGLAGSRRTGEQEAVWNQGRVESAAHLPGTLPQVLFQLCHAANLGKPAPGLQDFQQLLALDLNDFGLFALHICHRHHRCHAAPLAFDNDSAAQIPNIRESHALC